MTIVSQPFAAVIIESATKVTPPGGNTPFKITSPIIPPPPGLTCISNFFYECFWTGSFDFEFFEFDQGFEAWTKDSFSNPVTLTPVGTWNPSTYRPTTLNVTVNLFGSLGVTFPVAVDVFMEDSDGVQIGTASHIYTGANTPEILTMSLDFSGSLAGAGLGDMVFQSDIYGGALHVECIQFFPDAPMPSCSSTHFDTDFWSSFWWNFNMNDQEWIRGGLIGSSTAILEPKNNWNINTFRPTNMRVTLRSSENVLNAYPASLDLFLDDTDGVQLGSTCHVIMEPANPSEDIIFTVDIVLDYTSSMASAGIGDFMVSTDMYVDGPDILCIQFIGA